MSPETTAVAVQYRLQEWVAQIRECQNRPAGMSVVDWCASHGITKADYYYRLASLIETQTGNRPYTKDTLYLFCGRRTDRIKERVSLFQIPSKNLIIFLFCLTVFLHCGSYTFTCLPQIHVEFHHNRLNARHQHFRPSERSAFISLIFHPFP